MLGATSVRSPVKALNPNRNTRTVTPGTGRPRTSRTTPVITPPRAIVIDDVGDRLAVFHDDGRAGAFGPRGAVAGREIGVLERLQLEPARRQTVKRERAGIVGRRGLTGNVRATS